MGIAISNSASAGSNCHNPLTNFSWISVDPEKIKKEKMLWGFRLKFSVYQSFFVFIYFFTASLFVLYFYHDY